MVETDFCILDAFGGFVLGKGSLSFTDSLMSNLSLVFLSDDSPDYLHCIKRMRRLHHALVSIASCLGQRGLLPSQTTLENSVKHSIFHAKSQPGLDRIVSGYQADMLLMPLCAPGAY